MEIRYETIVNEVSLFRERMRIECFKLWYLVAIDMWTSESKEYDDGFGVIFSCWISWFNCYRYLSWSIWKKNHASNVFVHTCGMWLREKRKERFIWKRYLNLVVWIISSFYNDLFVVCCSSMACWIFESRRFLMQQKLSKSTISFFYRVYFCLVLLWLSNRVNTNIEHKLVVFFLHHYLSLV